jgi:flagellar hook protein FlgE
MLVGFTGINANTTAVDTVGNNLANLNTTAFKGQRTLFETLLYRTVDEGEAPTPTTGGTLPYQIGYGVGVAALQRNFVQGGLESTGFPADLAIEGAGLFILEQPGGEQVYTRDGAFRLDSTNTLVSANGATVQVFAADEAGNIDTGALSDLVIPLGTASQARATTEVTMEGRLDGGTEAASAGAVVESQPLVTSTGAEAADTTALTDLVDEFGAPLFADGDELTINATKGGVSIEEATFLVGATGQTLGDLATHLETVLGINTDPVTGGSPGVTVSAGPEPPAGTLVISSNLGEINAIELDGGSITNRTGAITSPFTFTTTTPAVGGGMGTTTSFNVFDSLGNPVDVRLRLAMESRSQTGTTWRFYAESIGDSDLSPILGTGTLTFDVNGQFVAATGTELSIDRADTGAASPLTFGLDFSSLTGLASADGSSEVSMADQDGAPVGIMTGYEIDPDGTVTGSFSNQQEQVLGQIALATFVNYEGLIARSESTFVPGPDSGDPTVITPQTGTAGVIRSGMLEQSNVEIAREFINLITASTGVSAASRVVRASDELLQELLLLAR